MTLSSVLFLVFVILGFFKGEAENRQLEERDLKKINGEALARLEFSWEKLPPGENPLAGVAAEEEFLGPLQDLDVFGKHSLFQWICFARTPLGKKNLASWALHPAGEREIRLRQEAARELSLKVDLQQRFLVKAGQAGTQGPQDMDTFLKWSVGPGWMKHKKFLIQSLRILVGGTLLSITLEVLGFSPFSLPLWVPFLLGNLFLSYFYKETMDQHFADFGTTEKGLGPYHTLFTLIRDENFQSEKLRDIQIRLRQEGGDPRQGNLFRSLKHLFFLLDLSSYRLVAPYYVFFQALFLLDFHLLLWLEKWKEDRGHFLETWFSQLGEFEALLSLGILTRDHPDWVFPDIRKGASEVVVQNLVHPLIPGNKGVPNDLTLRFDGTFAFVSGANMSGKSTFLRALGCNILLANLGAPVRATSFQAPPLLLGVSLSVHDSLEKGESFYYAELVRIKKIRYHFQKAVAGAEPLAPVFLCDEFLKGTHAEDRRVVGPALLLQLLGEGATGVVTSQDEDFVNHESLAGKFQMYHFLHQMEKVGEEEVPRFIYKLSPGKAQGRTGISLFKNLDRQGPFSS